MKNFGFGCMRLPRLDPHNYGSVDIEEFKKMVDVYLENGFTYFDTAYKYCGGNSESSVREALVKRHPRDTYILTTKLSSEFMSSKEEQEQVFNKQFENLGVDYIDYYLLHNIGLVNYKVSLELDSFEFAKKQKTKGLVKHIGMSYHDNAELLDDILSAHPELEVVQLQINYLDWENESIQSRKCYEVARKHNKPVLVMEPLKGGTLAAVPEEVERLFKKYNPDLSPASWALRFAASHEGVMMVLSGMSDMAQLLDNISTMRDFKPFNEEEFNIAYKAADIIRQKHAIPCTGCRYCVETCPKNIPIPDYLALLQAENFSTQFAYYYNYAHGHGKAGDCIECLQCEKHCPQHIAISKHMKDVSSAFDWFKGYRQI